MIVGNTLSEIGDILYIDTQVSISANFVQLTSYTDSTIGETATRFFNKKFRVSHDGLIYTDWYELNNSTVSQISGAVINNNLFIQYRYERAGTDTTGLLEFVSVNIVGNVTPTICNSPVSNNSIFKGLSCGNFVTMQLCNNLLKKLYKKGIIPEYIERGGSTEEDEDYIAFWSAIACYMAMFVTFMTRFESMYMDRELLLEYLKQLGAHVCEWETTLEDLQYISDNFFDEVRKRGTKQIFLRKGDEYQDSDLVPVDGEVLRILCREKCDEFLWTLRELQHTGWNIGNYSPLYKGTAFDNNLIKGFEKTEECLDLSKYVTFGTVNNIGGTINLTDGSGIGWQDFNSIPLVKDDGIVVDSRFNYEITFSIKSDNISGLVNFGCYAFDCYNNKYFLQRIDNGNSTSEFINNWKVKQVGKYYFFRGIIYSHTQQLITSPEKYLNISEGINLRFGNTRINKIMPYVHVNKANFNIYDFKVRPLNYGHSCGFLNTANLIELFTDNGNKKNTFNQIHEIIRRDLIPYNTNLIINTPGCESVPNDSIIYIHIDTSSMAPQDQLTIKNAALNWWSNFQATNPDFEGSLLINTVNNEDISNDYASGRNGRGVLSINNSTIKNGTVEAWLENPAEALLRQGWKEGLNSFVDEDSFFEYIEGKSLVLLSFTDETHSEYHLSSPVSFNQGSLIQPSEKYIEDYNNFINKVRSKLSFFKGVLYPITRVNTVYNDSFLLHAIGAIEAKILSNAEINNLLGPAKVLSYGSTNMINKFYNNLNINNPYSVLPGLKAAGWEGNYTKTSPASAVLNSDDFAEELNSILSARKCTESIIY